MSSQQYKYNRRRLATIIRRRRLAIYYYSRRLLVLLGKQISSLFLLDLILLICVILYYLSLEQSKQQRLQLPQIQLVHTPFIKPLRLRYLVNRLLLFLHYLYTLAFAIARIQALARIQYYQLQILYLVSLLQQNYSIIDVSISLLLSQRLVVLLLVILLSSVFIKRTAFTIQRLVEQAYKNKLRSRLLILVIQRDGTLSLIAITRGLLAPIIATAATASFSTYSTSSNATRGGLLDNNLRLRYS